jgi:hypothetical protein
MFDFARCQRNWLSLHRALLGAHLSILEGMRFVKKDLLL